MKRLYRAPLEQRLLFYIEKKTRTPYMRGGPCWVWVGHRTADGYGALRVGDTMKRTHRIAYEIYVGEIPEGLLVCHRCDNPACCNPAHLFVGSDADNVDDMIRKGRMARGEDGGNAVLTEEQVADIRLDTRPLRTIAKEYGVCHATIGEARRRATWAHVP
jgi:hypothetical protein